jgi:PAS domain S-box-containing protein
MHTNAHKKEKLNISVLYVEDDEMIRDALGRLLSMIVANVYTASDGAKGLAMFKSVNPDFVITDISMPIMDGLELCKRIRESDTEIPIIITTAHHETKNFMEAIQAQVSRFMLKPIDITALEKEIVGIYRNLQLAKEFNKQKKLLDEYKKAVDISSIVSKTDKNGNIIYVNDEFCRISGYTQEELIGQSHNIVRHPNTLKETFETLWRTILSKKVWSGVIENMAKDGQSYWADTTIIPILDESDEVIEFIDIRKDITKMIMQEREIEKLNASQLRQSVTKVSESNAVDFLQLSPCAALIVDKNSKIIGINDDMLCLFNPLMDADKIESAKDGLAFFDELFEIYEISQDGGDGARLQWNEALTWLEINKDSLCVAVCDDALQRRFKILIKPVAKSEDHELMVFFLN